MAEHSVYTVSAAKKFLAAGGLALAVVGLGLFSGPGTAAADGHNAVNPDGTFGAADVDNAYGQDLVPAVQSYVTSSYPAGSSYPASSGSYENHGIVPASSYPAGSSYPGAGWGVADD